MEALEKDVNKLTKTLPRANRQIKGFGRAAKGAAGGVGL